MKTRFTYFLHVSLAITLVLVTLNVSIAFATSSGVKIEKNTNASTDDLDVVIQLINTPPKTDRGMLAIKPSSALLSPIKQIKRQG